MILVNDDQINLASASLALLVLMCFTASESISNSRQNAIRIQFLSGRKDLVHNSLQKIKVIITINDIKWLGEPNQRTVCGG